MEPGLHWCGALLWHDLGGMNRVSGLPAKANQEDPWVSKELAFLSRAHHSACVPWS